MTKKVKGNKGKVNEKNRNIREMILRSNIYDSNNQNKDNEKSIENIESQSESDIDITHTVNDEELDNQSINDISYYIKYSSISQSNDSNVYIKRLFNYKQPDYVVSIKNRIKKKGKANMIKEYSMLNTIYTTEMNRILSEAYKNNNEQIKKNIYIKQSYNIRSSLIIQQLLDSIFQFMSNEIRKKLFLKWIFYEVDNKNKNKVNGSFSITKHIQTQSESNYILQSYLLNQRPDFKYLVELDQGEICNSQANINSHLNWKEILLKKNLFELSVTEICCLSQLIEIFKKIEKDGKDLWHLEYYEYKNEYEYENEEKMDIIENNDNVENNSNIDDIINDNYNQKVYDEILYDSD